MKNKVISTMCVGDVNFTEAQLDAANYQGPAISAFNMKTSRISTGEQRRFIVTLIMEVSQGLELPKGVSISPAITLLAEFASRFIELNIPFMAQGIHLSTGAEDSGSVTAEVVKDTGAFGSIIGHSEARRTLEKIFTSLGVNNVKQAVEDHFIELMHQAFSAGLKVVYCLGEEFIPSSDDRSVHDMDKAKEFVKWQYEYVLSKLNDAEKEAMGAAKEADEESAFVIAYEPRYAIKDPVLNPNPPTPTPKMAHEMAVLSRTEILRYLGEGLAPLVPVLYGGSADASNITTIGGSKYFHGALAATAAYKIGENGKLEVVAMSENKQAQLDGQRKK